MLTVGYLRLSKEDGDDVESSSISNQRKIIEDFARNNGMEVDKYYVDDGYTGYTEERPQFKKLKEDLNNNIVHTIIVKDLSRIGRNNGNVSLFLDNIENADKRVLTANGQYDTYKPETHGMASVQILFNDFYVKDISRKIKRSIGVLQKEGKYITNVPYGYIKDPNDKSKYYIDDTCAKYVKQIFDMYINEGMGLKLIAKTLSDNNVPTPSMIRKQHIESRGETFNGKTSTLWDASVINKMLKNTFYIGTLTLGKTTTKGIKGRKVAKPDDEKLVFENAHEAIIGKKTFNLAQRLLKDRTIYNYRGKRIQSRPNIFAGLLYCSDCGNKLTSTAGRANTRYICRTYNTHGTSQCTSHAIYEYELRDTLIYFLRHCRDKLTDIIEDIDKILIAENKADSKTHTVDIQKLLEQTKQDAKSLAMQKIREIQKNPVMADTIEEMYEEMLNEKYKEINVLEKQILDQSNDMSDDVMIKKNVNSALSIMNEIIESKELTKKQVYMLVDKIIVYDNSGVDIYLHGDLHKLYANYFVVEDSKYMKMAESIYNYIIESPERFSIQSGLVLARQQGIKSSYKNYANIYGHLLDNNIIELRSQNYGYKLIASKEELYDSLFYNNVASATRWTSNNSEILKVLRKISKWIEKISANNSKRLF